MSNTLPACEGGKPVREKYLVFGSPIIGEAEKAAVMKTLESCWLGTGPQTMELQKVVADYVGAKHALAVNSCTAALHLAMLANGIGPGDEVITSPMTFAATANSILHTGAKPVFVDCDKRTQNIDAGQIEAKITKRTRAILPIHLAGLPCDLKTIWQIAKKHNLIVIEDAAHALGAKYEGKPIGALSDATCFSFYVTKNLTTGEGGMLTTNNSELAAKVAMYSLHGLSADAWTRFSDKGYKHYFVGFPGFKYNMMDLQACIGLQQFKQFDGWQVRRKNLWQRYQEELRSLPLFLPPQPPGNVEHAYHLFSVHLDLDKLKVGRDQILNALHKENIGVGVHYMALHLHPYYKETFGFKPQDFPNAAWISDRTISIPFTPKLTDADVNDVVAALKKVLGYYSK